MTHEAVLEEVRYLVHVGLGGCRDDKIEMGVDELFVLLGDIVKDVVDVLDDNLVGGVGNGGVAVAFLLQTAELGTLMGKEDNLIVYDGVEIWNLVNLRHKVDGEGDIVHRELRDGTEDAGEAVLVDVEEGEHLRLT